MFGVSEPVRYAFVPALGGSVTLVAPWTDRLWAHLELGGCFVIENYIPGTLARYGLDYDSIKAINPGIIYGQVKGFGEGSPYENNLAFDMIAQATGGIMSVTGHEGGPPTRVGSSIGDLGAGLFTALGIVTVSDRASQRVYEDKGGPAIAEYLGLKPRWLDSTAVGGAAWEVMAAHADPGCLKQPDAPTRQTEP